MGGLRNDLVRLGVHVRARRVDPRVDDVDPRLVGVRPRAVDGGGDSKSPTLQQHDCLRSQITRVAAAAQAGGSLPIGWSGTDG